MVEQLAVNQLVAGSIPALAAITRHNSKRVPDQNIRKRVERYRLSGPFNASDTERLGSTLVMYRETTEGSTPSAGSILSLIYI